MATSSADPQALEAYLRASASMGDAVRARVSHLLSDYDEVVPRLGWGVFDATEALADLVTWARLNDADDEWLTAVASAFSRADGAEGDGMVPAHTMLGDTLLDGQLLDGTVLDGTVLDGTVLDDGVLVGTVLDDRVLDRTVTVTGVQCIRVDLSIDGPTMVPGPQTSGYRDGDQLLTTSALADWERAAGRGLRDHLVTGAEQLVTDPVDWVGDHGDDLVAAGMIAGGAALVASGVGAPVGAGLLIGAGLSTAGQVMLTGHLDGRQVWADAAVGGLTGGVGAGAASVTSRLGLTGARAAGTTALLDGGAAGAASPVHQYLTTGRVDLTDAGLSALVATIPGATSYWLAWPGPSGLVWIRRSVDGLDDVPKVWTTTGRIKAARLPTRGKIRFVPPKRYHPGVPLPRGPNGIYDKFGNEWTKGPSRTAGDDFEWDVQLSRHGVASIGHLSRDGSHVNVSLQGRVTHP